MDYLAMPREEFIALLINDNQNWKKIRALRNLASCAPIAILYFLKEMHAAFRAGFLCRAEEEYLNHLLVKYKMDYLTWCYKTKRLKILMKKIRERTKAPPVARENQRQPELPFLDWEKKRSNVYVGLNVNVASVKQDQKTIRAKRA